MTTLVLKLTVKQAHDLERAAASLGFDSRETFAKAAIRVAAHEALKPRRTNGGPPT